MVATNIAAIYPLSPMQQGMLFHSLFAPETGVYIEQLSCSLHGALDVDAFTEAWQHVLNRHESLRAAFVWEDVPEPLMVVGQKVKVPLTREDWRDLPQTEQNTRLDQFTLSDRHTDFKLSKAPLMRLAVIALADDVFHFVWSYHHLLMDGWSIPVVMREVLVSYDSIRSGQAPRLTRAQSYGEYVAWLSRQDEAQSERFWREQLSGFTAPTPMLSDRAATGFDGDGGQYGQEQLRLSLDGSAAIQNLARQHHLTLNTLVLGAWALLLSYFSREQDVVFGATFSGRPAGINGIEEMVGLFINTLPVRVNVAPLEPLLTWLSGLQEQQIEIQQYSFSPLIQIQGWSDVARGSTLFDSILVFENFPVESSAGQSNQSFELADFSFKEKTNFPITVLAAPGTSVLLRISYDGRLYDKATIVRMLGHFQTVLESMARNPYQKLSEITVLSEAERQQAVTNWNQTATVFPHDSSFIALFEQQVTRSPDALAASCDGAQLTYSQLDELAQRVAARILASGIRTDQVVALLCERGLLMLVAVLGVFKANAAYLPLDPRHPAARLRQVLTQSKVPLVLCASELAGRLTLAQSEQPESERADVWTLEEVVEDLRIAEVADESRTVVDKHAEIERSPVEPHQLAYLIYTSGSTGQPKGVMVEQLGMLNHFYAKIVDLQLTKTDVVAQTASQCFDISVWQMLGPLLVGARVEIMGDEIAHDAKLLVAQLIEREVTICEVVPSLLSAMVGEFAARDEASEKAGGDGAAVAPQLPLGRLRWMIATGEALPVELCRQWLDVMPGVPLLNAYGPTECSDDVAHYAIRSELDICGRQVPIGKAIANTQLYIVDERMEPLAVGVRGELVVGGMGVGRGYWQEAEKTAQVFVSDRLSGAAGARMYRTGDVGRYLEDGRIEYLGRRDHQVKVRGYRIELGEIEAALQKHPEVREAVVMAREDLAGDKRLVAYLVGAGRGWEEAERGEPKEGRKEGASHGSEIGESERSVSESEARVGVRELRRYLEQRIPEYMIPVAYVWLAELPLNRNGKVERSALPLPKIGEREGLESEYAAPVTSNERLLAKIVGEVLGVTQVGLNDNFFELGGHSLTATQLVSRIRKELDVDLPLRRIFDQPTIVDLAASITLMQIPQADDHEVIKLLEELDGLTEDEVKSMLDEEERLSRERN